MGNGIQSLKIDWIKGNIRAVLGFGCLVLLFVSLYFQVVQQLVSTWLEDQNNSHGILIPFISLWLVWERRMRLALVTHQPNALGLFVVSAGIILLLLGDVANLNILSRLSLIIVIVGGLLYLFGTQMLRSLSFPILYLLFMIPVPFTLFEMIAIPLQTLAASFATASLQLFNIPVLREGNIIELANTRLEVAQACSGIRSLMSLVALALLLGYLTQEGRLRRTLFVLSAVPIAIIANAIRVSGTGMLAYHYGPSVAEGFYHTFSGWIIFLVAFVLLGAEGYIFSLSRKKM